MRVFAKLRAIADYQRRHLPEMRTPEDHELIREIGHHQVLGAPLTLKQVMLLGIGSAATAQRRLGRLKRLGLVRGRRSRRDGRVVELTLSPVYMKAFARLDAVLASDTAGASAPRPARRADHACALCEGDAHAVDAMLRFLREGVARGRRCVFMGPQRLVSKVERMRTESSRRKDCGRLVTSTGSADTREVMTFLGDELARADAEGKSIRIAIHLGWATERRLPFESILRIEDEIKHLIERHDGQVLCMVDARSFTGPHLVALLKAHGDGRTVALEVG